MFAPEWRKSHKLEITDGLLTIPLPEDDGVALQFICAVIHHENHTIPTDVTAPTVLRIAVMADKYDCSRALRYARESWLNPAKDAVDDLSILTTAAYLFNNASAFWQLTKQMILTWKGPFAAASWGEMEDMLDWKLLGLLEEARSSARLELADILMRGATNGSGACEYNCGWSSIYAFAYISLLKDKLLFPGSLHHFSVAEAIKRAGIMSDPVPEEDSGTCRYARRHRVPEYRKERERPLEELENKLGLCLPCVKSGDGNAANCQKSHEDGD